jgi:hypothetical protein
VTDLAAGAAAADLLDAHARPFRPLTVVDLDLVTAPAADDLERAVRRARDSGRLLVGRTGRPVPDAHPPVVGQPGPVGGDPGSPGAQEVGDLVTAVHASSVTRPGVPCPGLGGPASTFLANTCLVRAVFGAL